MNDDVITRLRAAADSEMLPPRPVDQLVRDARRRRARQRAGAVTGGLTAVVVVTGAVLGGLSLSGGFEENLQVSAPGPTGSTPSTAPANGPAGAESTDPARPTGSAIVTVPAGPTTAAWPAPPTSRPVRPWLRAGHDYGRLVAARYVNGDIVITVNREQIYTREEWRRRTGEVLPGDFRTVNSSTRTRDFVVDPGALVQLSDQFDPRADGDHLEKIDARELVRRTTAALARQRASGAENPGITVWLFHRGSEDGPVAYLEDAALSVG